MAKGKHKHVVRLSSRNKASPEWKRLSGASRQLVTAAAFARVGPDIAMGGALVTGIIAALQMPKEADAFIRALDLDPESTEESIRNGMALLTGRKGGRPPDFREDKQH